MKFYLKSLKKIHLKRFEFFLTWKQIYMYCMVKGLFYKHAFITFISEKIWWMIDENCLICLKYFIHWKMFKIFVINISVVYIYIYNNLAFRMEYVFVFFYLILHFRCLLKKYVLVFDYFCMFLKSIVCDHEKDSISLHLLLGYMISFSFHCLLLICLYKSFPKTLLSISK